MFGVGSILLADSSPVSAAGATRYEFTQWSAFSEWWQTPLLVLACIAVVAFVAWMYRRDSVELRPGVGVFLAVGPARVRWRLRSAPIVVRIPTEERRWSTYFEAH